MLRSCHQRSSFGIAYSSPGAAPTVVPDVLVRASLGFHDLPRHLSTKVRAKMSFSTGSADLSAHGSSLEHPGELNRYRPSNKQSSTRDRRRIVTREPERGHRLRAALREQNCHRRRETATSQAEVKPVRSAPLERCTAVALAVPVNGECLSVMAVEHHARADLVGSALAADRLAAPSAQVSRPRATTVSRRRPRNSARSELSLSDRRDDRRTRPGPTRAAPTRGSTAPRP